MVKPVGEEVKKKKDISPNNDSNSLVELLHSNSLLQTTPFGCLPLHITSPTVSKDVGQCESMVYDVFPPNRGGFKKLRVDRLTPIKTVLHHFKKNKRELMKVIDTILHRYINTDTDTDNNYSCRNNNKMIDDAILTAAIQKPNNKK